MNNESIFVVFCLQFLLANTYTIEHKKTFLAREGDHVIMEVEHYEALVRIEFRPTPDYLVKNFFGPEMQEGYKYSSNGSVGYFEIFNLTKRKADYYEFFYALFGGGGVEYAINIVLADLQCGLNFPKYYIVDNDCQEVRKDKIDLWCRLVLSEPTNAIFPIAWKTVNGNRRIMSITYKNETYSEAREVDVALNEGDTIETYASTIRCATTFSPQLKIHANNKTSREFTSYRINPMTPDNIEPVTCQANVSQFVHCSYEWRHKDGDVVNKFQGNILHKEDLKANGTYECIASCVIKDYSAKQCVLLSDRVKFSAFIGGESKSKNVFIIILISLVVLLLIVTSALLYSFVFRKKFSKTTFEVVKIEEKNENENLIEPDNKEGTIQLTDLEKIDKNPEIIKPDKIEETIDPTELEKIEEDLEVKLFPENFEIILLFIEKMEKSLQKDVAAITDSIKYFSKFSKDLQEDAVFLKSFSDFASFFEKMSVLENDFSKYCEDISSFKRYDEDELRKQLRKIKKQFNGLTQTLEITLENKRSWDNLEHNDPLSKVNPLKIENVLKFFNRSNFETVLQNLLDILGGPSTFSINLEKFLDLDDELLQIWNGLSNLPDIYMKLKLYHDEIGKKVPKLEQELNEIDNTISLCIYPGQFDLKNKYKAAKERLKRSLEKHSEMLSLTDKLWNCLDGSSILQDNFFIILNWKDDFKILQSDFEKVYDIQIEFDEIQCFFKEINDLENEFLLFQKEFEKDAKNTEKLKSLQNDIMTKLMDLGQAFKNLEKELLSELSELEEPIENDQNPISLNANKKIFFLKEQILKLRDTIQQCLSTFQKFFGRPIIIQIDIENLFESLKGFENIAEASVKLARIRSATEKELERTKKMIKEEKIESIGNLRNATVFIGIVERGYNGYVDLSINLIQIEELKTKLSEIRNDMNKSEDLLKYSEQISSYERYFENFGNLHKDYISYKDYLLLKVYVELKKKKEALEKVLADSEKDLNYKPQNFKTRRLKVLKEGTKQGLTQLYEAKNPLVLQAKLTQLKFFLQKFQNSFVHHTSIYIILEKCLDGELLGYWKGLAKDASYASTRKALKNLKSEIKKKKQEYIEEQKNLNKPSEQTPSTQSDIPGQIRSTEEKFKSIKLIEMIKKFSRMEYFIERIFHNFTPHKYALVNYEAICKFHQHSLDCKLKLEDYHNYLGNLPRYIEFIEILSEFIDDISKYKKITTKKERTQKRYFFHLKIMRKREVLQELFKDFEKTLEKTSPFPRGTQDYKIFNSMLNDFAQVKSYLEEFLQESTLLSIDLDKCLELDSGMKEVWLDFKNTTYMTWDVLENLRTKQTEFFSNAHVRTGT